MDEEVVDPIIEDEAGIPQSYIPTSSEEDHRSQRSCTGLKHKLPSLLSCPKNRLNTNSVTNKFVAAPYSLPRPESFILKQDCGPPLCIPLNDEGDKIVCGLFDHAIEEYLTLGINELSIRQKYNWMDRWAVLRYKQVGTTPKLSKYDAQSLDEIFSYKSDMDQEPEPTTAESHSAYLPRFYQPKLYSTSVADFVPQESAHATVRPRVTFYNSNPEDFSVGNPKHNKPTRQGKSKNVSPSRSLFKQGNRAGEETSGQFDFNSCPWLREETASKESHLVS